jgi:hypothetical protein
MKERQRARELTSVLDESGRWCSGVVVARDRPGGLLAALPGVDSWGLGFETETGRKPRPWSATPR